jgi:hypothetical protein
MRRTFGFTFLVAVVLVVAGASAQTVGGAGTIQGTVVDPNGAVIAGATITIQSPVSGFQRTTRTDKDGTFTFPNLPQNGYHLAVTAPGFQGLAQDVDVRSSVPIVLSLKLQIGKSETSVTVTEATDLIESDPTAHTDVAQSVLTRLPVQSTTSALNEIVTHGTPGVVADSNGFAHPQGDHAQMQYSVDGESITDQQSRTFSNQISPAAIQSLEVISGVPPAEFGDKDSLVIRATTKSGLTQKPVGALALGYGTFGSPTGELDFGAGSQRWGNFVAVTGMRSGRFLDAPEFLTIHDAGNSGTLFDRIDFQPRQADSFHLDLFAARSWFQIPDDFTQAAAGQDQRQRIVSFNIAPGYTHLFSQYMLLSANAYFRKDQVNYFPSADVFSDQPATLAQSRQLSNIGLRSDLSYVRGHHNVKAGVDVKWTPLRESFALGITDPTFNPPCNDPGEAPPCNVSGANSAFNPGVAAFDLTRGGTLFNFRGATTVKQQALYVQDMMTFGQFSLQLGVRGDHYDAISTGSALEPRAGASYLIKKTNTVLRGAYGREFETPYNENLILSSSTGVGGLASNVFGAVSDVQLTPGHRNHFTAGLQQAFGRWLVVDADYFWKFTRGAFDFDTLFNTPVAFPIEWKKSKIDGAAFRVSIPEHHGFSVVSVMGHTRSRFFNPESGGILFNSPIPSGAFRIDHDQVFQQTTTVFYSFLKKMGGFSSFSWNYESGLVAGSVPDFATALTLTGDEQQQIGLFCGNVFATFANPITSCSSSNFGATRVQIPAAGTEDDDHNPPRIAPRHLFNAGVGFDNLFHTEKYKLGVRVTAYNLTNKVALYNFESTFSGTHFVSPRTVAGQVTFGF